MSTKSRLVAAVAILTLLGGLGTAGSLSASAATPSCGASCTNLFAQLYGPAFVIAVQGQGENVGQPIILAPASASNPAEDFTVSDQGLVSDFIAAGLVSPGLSAYNDDPALEIEYSPFGVSTGLCMGLGATPTNNTPVDLEPCGVSAKTVWIPNANPPTLSGSFPLISGATNTSFSSPYALSDLKPGGDRQLFTWPLQGGGILHNKFANQLWGATFSVIPSS